MSDIHSKLAKIAGEIGPINKDERNREQGFNFRSIEQITAAARPLFAAEGVSVAPQVIKLEHSEVTAKSGARGFRAIVHMAYIFTAGSDGSFLETSMVGEAVDYGDKSTSKAVQMAYKYALTQVLQVGSGDDPDAHSVDVGQVDTKPKGKGKPQASEKPVEAPQTSVTSENGAEVKRLKNWLLKEAGDVDLAKRLWRDTLASYGLGPADNPSVDMLSSVENDLQIALKEAAGFEAVEPEQETLEVE